MKKFYKEFIMSLAALMLTCQVSMAQIETPAPSPFNEWEQTVGLTKVKVQYSRPGVKGRTIFGTEDEGALVPYGKIWRTGANASTKISFSDDVKLEGNEIEAGEYAIYTIPNKDKWTVMLYNDLSLGGNVGNYDESKEYVRFDVEAKEVGHKHESFTVHSGTLTNNSAEIYFVWEMTKVPMKLEVDYDEKVMSAIEKQMKNPLASAANLYFSSANYYYNENKDMEQALAWISKGLEINPNAFWHMHTKAKIQAALGDKKGAKETAEKSKEMALANPSGDFGYAKRNDDLLKELKGK
jgi:tetratricopeptide (TPR) repeat protein